ncbi:MAG: YdcF family protein [Reyranella sp.]|nr:YdcF family protein [Reyranella sp.]
MFVVAKLFWLVANPGNLLVLLSIAGAGFQFTRYQRLAKATIAVSAAYGAMLLLPIGAWLAAPLENSVAREPLPSKITGIVVLGSGVPPFIALTRHAIPSHIALGRFIAAAAIARAHPEAEVVFSSGSGALGGGLSERFAAEEIFSELGVDSRRIIYEDRSRNTAENIAFSKRLVQPKSGQTWVLVTSAVHMPRAMAYADDNHWKMIPWPSDYLTPHKPYLSVPQTLVMVSIAEREYYGLLARKLFGSKS